MKIKSGIHTAVSHFSFKPNRPFISSFTASLSSSNDTANPKAVRPDSCYRLQCHIPHTPCPRSHPFRRLAGRFGGPSQSRGRRQALPRLAHRLVRRPCPQRAALNRERGQRQRRARLLHCRTAGAGLGGGHTEGDRRQTYLSPHAAGLQTGKQKRIHTQPGQISTCIRFHQLTFVCTWLGPRKVR